MKSLGYKTTRSKVLSTNTLLQRSKACAGPDRNPKPNPGSKPRRLVHHIAQRASARESPAIVHDDLEPPVIEVGPVPAICGVSKTFGSVHNWLFRRRGPLARALSFSRRSWRGPSTRGPLTTPGPERSFFGGLFFEGAPIPLSITITRGAITHVQPKPLSNELVGGVSRETDYRGRHQGLFVAVDEVGRRGSLSQIALGCRNLGRSVWTRCVHHPSGRDECLQGI